jgi:hypothetical protein
MPWTPKDALSHNSACKSDKAQDLWAKVANETLERELKKDTNRKKAEGIAIASANKAVSNLNESLQPAFETLQEYATSAGVALRIDREHGVIAGCKILGLQSRNGRTYDTAAVAKAMPMYEGAAVFVDHGKAGQSRSYHDRMGRLQNVRASQDGLYADFCFNPKHVLAEQLLWDAEHAPGNVGFSHDVQGKTRRSQDGSVVVEAIERVDSVDLVAKPATTRSLFEDTLFEGPIAAKIEADAERRALCTTCCCAMDMVRTTMYDDELTAAARIKKILAVLADWGKELTDPSSVVVAAATQTESQEPTMDIKDLTVEMLREQRKDLVELLTGTDATSKLKAELDAEKAATAKVQEDLQAANAKLAEIEAEKAKLAKQAAITEELKAAKLDQSDKAACSDLFMEQLNAATDVEARKRLIEDRLALVKQAPRSPIQTGAPFAPAASADTGPAPSHDSFSGVFAAK